MPEESKIPLRVQFSGSEVPLPQILADLNSSDKLVRGKTIELLGLCLTRLIDLDFGSWLLRSADSDGVETGIIASDRCVPFNRWHIQCRNANQMDMGDIATAIGRSILFRPHVLLTITTGHFTQQARDYAIKAMQSTNLRVLLIDGHDLNTIASDDKVIKSILYRETEKAGRVIELLMAASCA